MNAREYVTEISVPALTAGDLQVLRSPMSEPEPEPELELGRD